MNKTQKIFIIGILIGLLGGVILGTLYQQMIFMNGLVRFAYNLEGVEINIDLNETIMVDRMYELMEKDKPINYINKTKTVPADFIGPLQKGTIREVKA